MTQVRRVLLITQVGPSSPVIASIDRGIRDVLNQSPYLIEIYQESLETTLFPDPETQHQFREWYVRKYRSRQPDVIIAVGPDALNYLLDSHEAFFPGVPVVFCVSTPDDLSGRKLDSDFTGVWHKWEPEKTLEAALRLQPGTRHVVVIGGTASFDRGFLNLVRKGLRGYESRLDFTYLTDLSLSQILERVAHLPENTIILYTSVARDSTGAHFLAASQSGPMIAKVANAPVFAFSDANINHGEQGGYLVSFARMGELVGGMTLRILNGERPKDVPTVTNPNVYIFDWQALH